MMEINHNSEADYVITCGDCVVLCKDCSIKEPTNLNNEGMCLIEFWQLSKNLHEILEPYKCAITYVGKEMAMEDLKAMRPRLEQYFDRKDWRVTRLVTTHKLETKYDYQPYGG